MPGADDAGVRPTDASAGPRVDTADEPATTFRTMNQAWTSPVAWVGRSALDVPRLRPVRRVHVQRGPRRAATRHLEPPAGRAHGPARRESLPIALFIAAFTGIVMALQASYTFTGAMPLYFVGVLVGKTMILELGPVLTGLALAGRVGANIAAEIGTMRVTEQIDALETLGYDPFAYLVVPRVLAGMLMFPVVVAFANAIGIIGGWITAINLLDMSTPEFVRGTAPLLRAVRHQFSLIKAASFGLAVTIDRRVLRLQHVGGAAAVGRSTTQAVVVSSMLILVLDAFWAVVLL
jgi:phospholipid/cholesterol/gamma-HCH transport system permease protein